MEYHHLRVVNIQRSRKKKIDLSLVADRWKNITNQKIKEATTVVKYIYMC
jgi:hypothetical protein